MLASSLAKESRIRTNVWRYAHRTMAILAVSQVSTRPTMLSAKRAISPVMQLCKVERHRTAPWCHCWCWQVERCCRSYGRVGGFDGCFVSMPSLDSTLAFVFGTVPKPLILQLGPSLTGPADSLRSLFRLCCFSAFRFLFNTSYGTLPPIPLAQLNSLSSFRAYFYYCYTLSFAFRLVLLLLWNTSFGTPPSALSLPRPCVPLWYRYCPSSEPRVLMHPFP